MPYFDFDCVLKNEFILIQEGILSATEILRRFDQNIYTLVFHKFGRLRIKYSLVHY